MNFLIVGAIITLTGTFLMTRDIASVKFIGMIIFIIGGAIGLNTMD